MLITKKASEMLIDIAGGFITDSVELKEVEIHLEITVIAWNIAILPKEKRKSKLNRYIRKQAIYAPSKKDLEELKTEMKRLINNKVKKYPMVKNKIEKAEAIDKNNEFVIRAHYHKNSGDNREFIA